MFVFQALLTCGVGPTYNVTILDIAPVTIGDYVMIGPNTLISTVNHPMTPMGRRKHLGIGKR